MSTNIRSSKETLSITPEVIQMSMPPRIDSSHFTDERDQPMPAPTKASSTEDHTCPQPQTIVHMMVFRIGHALAFDNAIKGR